MSEENTRASRVAHRSRWPQDGALEWRSARTLKARDWFLKTLDYASECSCKHVTILVGAKFEGESHKESLNRAADELNWRLEKARAEGLVLGVEAHVGSLTPRPKSAA